MIPKSGNRFSQGIMRRGEEEAECRSKPISSRSSAEAAPAEASFPQPATLPGAFRSDKAAFPIRHLEVNVRQPSKPALLGSRFSFFVQVIEVESNTPAAV
jgi:hypothetical protein